MIHPENRTTLKEDKVTLAWLMIPLFYGISIFYSRDFGRAANQWLNLAPVLLLPLFFTVGDLKINREKLLKTYVICVLMVGLLQLVTALGMIAWNSQDPAMTSVIYDPEKHSFIIWSAIALSSWYSSRSVFWQIAVPLLFLNLFYYGQVDLILLSCLSYLVILMTQQHRKSRPIFAQTLIFGTGVSIISLVFFKVFRANLSDGLYNLVAIYTGENWTNRMSAFITDLRFSWYQWLKHPLTGVGIGDYADAIWNEYHQHNLEAPGYPHTQVLHFLVCAGSAAIFVLFSLVLSWRKMAWSKMVYLLLAIVVMIFAAPFKSQVTSTAFMLMVLMLPPSHE